VADNSNIPPTVDPMRLRAFAEVVQAEPAFTG
jgi:hypothetical protein